MNLYLLSQNTNNGWDTYDSCIVVAKNEDEAKLICPGYNDFTNNRRNNSWCNKPEDVTVEYIGIAAENLEEGIIVIDSFNAG